MNGTQKRQRPAATGRRGKSDKSFSLNDTSAQAQRARLLACLKHTAVDTLSARRDLNILMPAARIKELRLAGYRIETVRIELADEQGRLHRGVARYVLSSSGERHDLSA